MFQCVCGTRDISKVDDIHYPPLFYIFTQSSGFSFHAQAFIVPITAPLLIVHFLSAFGSKCRHCALMQLSVKMNRTSTEGTTSIWMYAVGEYINSRLETFLTWLHFAPNIFRPQDLHSLVSIGRPGGRQPIIQPPFFVFLIAVIVSMSLSLSLSVLRRAT